MARRAILVGLGTGIKLIGSRFSSDSRRLREFLARNQMPYAGSISRTTTRRRGCCSASGSPPAETPVVIASGGEILRNPNSAELGKRLGSARAPPTGALRCGRGRRGTRRSRGRALRRLGGLSTSRGWRPWRPEVRPAPRRRIENYLGFPAGISGNELTQRAFVQAGKFGARLTTPAKAVALRSEPGHHAIELSNGDDGRPVGRRDRHRRPVPPPRRARLDDFEGGGVYYAATQAEAQLCARRTGGGRRRGQLRRPGGDVPVRDLALPAADPRRRPGQVDVALPGRPGRAQPTSIEVCTHTEVVELHGERELDGVTVADNRSGERSQLRHEGVVRLHRRVAAHRVARGAAGNRQRRFPADRPRPRGRRPRPSSTASGRSSSRPAAPASSPSATSTPARSSGSPRRSARARWPSG